MEDNIDLNVTNMTEMIIKTRSSYPSDKITFTIADLTKNKAIRFFMIGMNLNGLFDVDLVLEDSQRNFLSSFISLLYKRSGSKKK